MKIYSLAFLLLFLFSLAFDQPLKSPQSSPQNSDHTRASNIIFKSTDGGQTWQDISDGLPENLQAENFRREGFFANDSGVYLSAGNELYHSRPNSTPPFWNKEIAPRKHTSIVSGNTGIFIYNWDLLSLPKLNGKKGWSPIFKNFPPETLTSVFETARGTVFIGGDYGFFRSTNNGKTWNQVQTGGWVKNVVESKGVLLATCQGGIIRSTDDGENWAFVLYESRVDIDVVPFSSGFAAITYYSASETRSVRTSDDGGKTWQPIDNGFEVGENFWSHRDRIFKSSDKRKTWKILRPSNGNKVSDLFVPGNVIYAIPIRRGC